KGVLERSGQPKSLRPILQSLFDAVNVEARGRWKQFRAGQGTLDIILNGSVRLLDAERQLSKDRADQLAALEHHLERVRAIEKINQERYDAGRISISDLAQSRYFRIQAELWLEQAKAQVNRRV